MRARYFEARNARKIGLLRGDEDDDNYTWVNRIFFPCDNDPPVENHLKPDVRLARTTSTVVVGLRNLCGCPRTKGKKYHSNDRATKKEEDKRKKKKKKRKGEKGANAFQRLELASSSFLSAAALKDRGIKADLWTFI